MLNIQVETGEYEYVISWATDTGLYSLVTKGCGYRNTEPVLVAMAKMFGLLTGDSPGMSVVVNQAETVELATLSTAELRRGVELLALSEGENPRISAPNEAISADQEQDSPTLTARKGAKRLPYRA